MPPTPNVYAPTMITCRLCRTEALISTTVPLLSKTRTLLVLRRGCRHTATVLYSMLVLFYFLFDNLTLVTVSLPLTPRPHPACPTCAFANWFGVAIQRGMTSGWYYPCETQPRRRKSSTPRLRGIVGSRRQRLTATPSAIMSTTPITPTPPKPPHQNTL